MPIFPTGAWPGTLPAIVEPRLAAVLALVLAAVGLTALLRERPRLAGTTLAAVWCWELVSLLAIGLTELLVALVAGGSVESWVLPLRLVAATSSFLPTMALLGAKRPQDRAWQWIVGTLWCILSLPSGQWLLFGGVREMHPAQLVFLAILVGVGLVNGLATRLWPVSVFFAAGQLALLAPFYAATFARDVGPAVPLAGFALLVAAWLLRTRQRPRPRAAAAPLDRVWLDFRDAFGAVWGVRIMERMNAAAAMYGWPVTLTWNGFRAQAEGDSLTAAPDQVAESLRTLLRRFVSAEWIDARLLPREPATAPTALTA
ncbi:MAG: hypothetical protein AB7O59_22630 [Pirellulales bacterium]